MLIKYFQLSYAQLNRIVFSLDLNIVRVEACPTFSGGLFQIIKHNATQTKLPLESHTVFITLNLKKNDKKILFVLIISLTKVADKMKLLILQRPCGAGKHSVNKKCRRCH